MEKTSDSEEMDQSQEAGTTAEMPLHSSGEVTVSHLPEPPRAPEGKQIHRRRSLPPITEGEDVPDKDPSPPADIE